MPKKKQDEPKDASVTVAAKVEATAPKEAKPARPAKFVKKNKSRLPRRQKKAQQKAAKAR